MISRSIFCLVSGYGPQGTEVFMTFHCPNSLLSHSNWVNVAWSSMFSIWSMFPQVTEISFPLLLPVPTVGTRNCVSRYESDSFMINCSLAGCLTWCRVCAVSQTTNEDTVIRRVKMIFLLHRTPSSNPKPQQPSVKFLLFSACTNINFSFNIESGYLTRCFDRVGYKQAQIVL